MKQKIFKKLRRGLFIYSIIFSFFVYGFLVGEYKIFPYNFFRKAVLGFQYFQKSDELPEYFQIISKHYETNILNTDKAFKGINLVTRITKDSKNIAEIIDMHGNILHQWNVDWFEIWKDADHLSDNDKPKSQPGTSIHGAVVLKNGNLIFNFDHLGLVCLDRDSNVIWKLPYKTHHSVQLYHDNHILVAGQKGHYKADSKNPNRYIPYSEYTILEINTKGRIINEWSIQNLLMNNEIDELLYFDSITSEYHIHDDRLHLNDVEPFPDNMKEDFFKKGDILLSFRNINTILVFNRFSGKVRYVSIGKFVRQHDPDFIDGNTISVFDNNHRFPSTPDLQSRILVINASKNIEKTYYEGSVESPFFTDIRGKHQWLPNGNLLITESSKGRAFEIDQEKNIVWEYVNIVDERTVGIVTEVQRLPLGYAGFK